MEKQIKDQVTLDNWQVDQGSWKTIRGGTQLLSKLGRTLAMGQYGNQRVIPHTQDPSYPRSLEVSVITRTSL